MSYFLDWSHFKVFVRYFSGSLLGKQNESFIKNLSLVLIEEWNWMHSSKTKKKYWIISLKSVSWRIFKKKLFQPKLVIFRVQIIDLNLDLFNKNVIMFTWQIQKKKIQRVFWCANYNTIHFTLYVIAVVNWNIYIHLQYR